MKLQWLPACQKVIKPSAILVTALIASLALQIGCTSVPYRSTTYDNPAQKASAPKDKPETTPKSKVSTYSPTPPEPKSAPSATTKKAPAKVSRAKPETSATEPNLNIPVAHRAIPFEQVLLEQQQQSESKPAAVITPKPKQQAPKQAVSIAPREQDAAPEQNNVGSTELKLARLQFNLDQLPLKVAPEWTLKTDSQQCSLHSQTVKVQDGAGMTPVTLVLDKNSWTIHTKSDIDLSYKNTGITLDSEKHFELEKVSKDTNVQFTNQYQELTDTFSEASQATISLGFWPTWPVTEAKRVQIPVANFAQAYQAWQTCNQLITAR